MGEKVVSPFYSSAILGRILGFIFLFLFLSLSVYLATSIEPPNAKSRTFSAAGARYSAGVEFRRAPLVAHMVKNLSVMWETWV